MDLKSELLKSIWYAFTSLDVEKCGKVSKSQLKVRKNFKIRKLRPMGVHWAAETLTVYFCYFPPFKEPFAWLKQTRTYRSL